MAATSDPRCTAEGTTLGACSLNVNHWDGQKVPPAKPGEGLSTVKGTFFLLLRDLRIFLWKYVRSGQSQHRKVNFGAQTPSVASLFLLCFQRQCNDVAKYYYGWNAHLPDARCCAASISPVCLWIARELPKSRIFWRVSVCNHHWRTASLGTRCPLWSRDCVRSVRRTCLAPAWRYCPWCKGMWSASKTTTKPPKISN